jgi:hypothetical protein
VADEVQAPARPFSLCAHVRVGQPDRRHELAARELGEHPGVDPIGLTGQRRQPLHLLRVGDLDLPAGALELVVHEARSVHRLDRRLDRLAMAIEPSCQSTQTVSIRRGRPDFERRALSVEQVKVETLAAEIQTGVQHCNGPPFVSRGRAEHDSAGVPPSSHSLPPTVLAHFRGFAGRRLTTGCHWLRPLGSKNAPSSCAV